VGLALAAAAIGVFGLGQASDTFAQQGCAGAGKISKSIAKPMKAAQDALNAKKWQEALNKAREASAVVGITAFDQHMINEFQGYAYTSLKQYPEAARELEAGYLSGCLEESDRVARLKSLTQLFYQTKNYAKAIDYGNKALKAGANGDLETLVGQAYYITNDYKNTLRIFGDIVADQERRGQVPKEQTLLLVQSACLKLNDSQCVTRQFEKLVSHYPKREYWQNLVSSLLQSESNNDRQLLNIMRLAVEVDVMQRPEQFTEMAQLALEQGLPGEAQGVLEEGFSKAVFKDQREQDRNKRLLESAKKQAEPDRASLAKQEAAAKAKPTGDADVKLGAAYLSYGQSEKAVEAIQRGLGKGGVKNPDEAALLLGIAHLRAGNKPEAAKAFKTVKEDPTLTRIAKLWLLNT
jgi:tetratricopeptide (TPR) repeat protein